VHLALALPWGFFRVTTGFLDGSRECDWGSWGGAVSRCRIVLLVCFVLIRLFLVCKPMCAFDFLLNCNAFMMRVELPSKN
jgi:hypothetical protein